MSLVDIFDSLSLKDLYKAKDLLEDKLKQSKLKHKLESKGKDINSHVTQYPQFLKADDVLIAEIQADLESLAIKRPRTGTSTLWLNSNNDTYSWNKAGGKVVNQPTSLDKAPGIKKALDKINQDLNLDLNSCLITLFKDEKVALRPHHDNEDEMDPNSPICVLTVGQGRLVKFYSVYNQKEPLLSLSPNEGTLYAMEVGCQDFFKHEVPQLYTKCGARFSLSFCKRIQPQDNIFVNPVINTSAPLKSDQNHNEAVLPSVEAPPSLVGTQHTPHVISDAKDLPKPKRSTVIFGTSITSNINPESHTITVGSKRPPDNPHAPKPRKIKLDSIAKGDRKFINMSKRGAKIHEIDQLIDDFYILDKSANDVEKVIFSFGTNDIKFETKGVLKFREPVVNLIKKAKLYFPDAIILIQCVLPMKNMYWYTAKNFLNFNHMLRGICHNYNCVYIDCFADFLSKDRRNYNRELFYDPFHLNLWGHIVLRKWLSKVCNSPSFDRVVDSWL